MSDDGRWQDCPPGMVTGMVDKLRRQQRASSVRPMIGVLVAVLLLGSGYALTSGLLSGSSALGCSEVIPLLAQYDNGTLSAPVAKQVKEHLSHCPSCRETYESSFSDEARRAVRLDPVVAVLVVWR